jgi:lysozyme
MLLGIDVWEGYGPIDWTRARDEGAVRFAIAKCTQGNDGKDPRFDQYVAGAKAAGVPVGAYHYGYALPYGDGFPAGRSPEEQARRFFEACKGLGSQAGELPPVLDMEFPARWDRRKVDAAGNLIDQWARWRVDGEFIARWTLAFLQAAEDLFKRVPVLYTYPDFWARLGAHGKLPEFQRYPLWIASYIRANEKSFPTGEKPLIPAPWTEFAIWQFSADGSPARVPGVPACPLDRNAIKDEDTLRRLLMVGAAQPAPPEFIDLTTIRGVQSALRAKGFDPGPVDGVFGAKTRAAVIAFQRVRGLTPDGVVGPKTRAALAAG